MLSPEISDLESFIDSYHSGAQNDNQMHHSPQSPSMRQACVDFGSFSAISSVQTPGTELWGEKPRGIDWGNQGSSEMREHFEHRRPSIQERGGQNNWNSEYSSMMQHNKMQQQQNISQTRSTQDQQKENKEMAAFIASLLHTQQQQKQMRQQQFNHPQQHSQQQMLQINQQQMLRNIRPPTIIGNQSRIPGSPATSVIGGEFYHQKQREMAAPRSVGVDLIDWKNLSAASQHEWVKLKEQQMSAVAQQQMSAVAQQQQQHHALQRIATSSSMDNNNGDGYTQQYQPNPPHNDVNKIIEFENFLQLKQQDNIKHGTTGGLMINNNPLQQSNSVSDLDVDELRKQLISGELVVVRKNDLMKAATKSNVDSKDEQQNNQQHRLSSEDASVFHHSVYKPPASRQLSSESSSSVEQRRPSTTFYKSPGRRSRSDEDPDWRSRDNSKTTPVARKPSFETQYRRKKSAADEDPDWRRRDTNDEVPQTKCEKEAGCTKPKKSSSQHDPKKMETINSNEGKTTNLNESPPRHKHHTSTQLTRNPKLEIHNWIATSDSKKIKQQPLDEIMKSLTIIEGNIDDSQLGSFIEKIQLGATTEEKLRSYADDLCNRAIGHPSFGYGASLLCHRMSWMMVEHGTKFRSMVFSNMEKQYKCREMLFRESFIVGNIRWFGLIHFISHLYLNVRVPDTDKRFAVLVRPVYNCLLQVLRSSRVTANQVKCFGEIFHLCGMNLEEDEVDMMSQLMSEVRDSSLTSQDPGIRNIYLKCVRTYATRWQE